MENGTKKQSSFRWLELVVGTVVLLVLGSLYAWSAYRGTLIKDFGWSASATQLTFSISMMTFCLGGLTSGILSKKTGARVPLIGGAIFMAAGLLTASFITSLPGLYVSYGVLYGFGVGLGYNAIMGTVVKWFPDKTGLASGVLLMGFGISSLLTGWVGARLIGAAGWRMTFMAFGIVFGLVVLVLAFFVKPPAEKDLEGLAGGSAKVTESFSESSAGEMLRTRNFWVFFVWAIVLSAAGLCIVGNSTTYADTIINNLETAAVVAGVISVCNGIGRVILGGMFDARGYRATMLTVIVLFLAATCLLLVSSATGSFAVLIIAYIVAGFAYGGVTPTNSAFIARFFGRRNYALNLSIVNLNLLVASYLPQVATALLDKTGSYNGMFYYMIVLAVIGLAATLLIKAPSTRQ